MRKQNDNIIATKSEKIAVLVVAGLFATLFVLYQFNSDDAKVITEPGEYSSPGQVPGGGGPQDNVPQTPVEDSSTIPLVRDTSIQTAPRNALPSPVPEGRGHQDGLSHHHSSHIGKQSLETRLSVDNTNNVISWSSELSRLRTLQLIIVPRADPTMQKSFSVSGMSKFEFKPDGAWWTGKKCDVSLRTADNDFELMNYKTDGYFIHK